MDGIILAVIALVVIGWWLSRKKRIPARLGATLPRRQAPAGKAIPNHLMRQLDRLTRDRRVSERLIDKIAFDNPGRSKRWCVEKAIYDIQRDRRS